MQNTPVPRQSTGIPGLDQHLDGGLLPGTLTVVCGATGIGKSQLGVQFANAGLQQEGQRGVLFDMCSRGDAQSHADYALRMFDWKLQNMDPAAPLDLEEFFASNRPADDYLHVFDLLGRRVTRRDLDFDAFHDWQAQLVSRLNTAIAFFYSAFLRGVRRCVVDGIEPVDRPSDSIQLEMFEYIYHQILRKEHDWVARDLLREHFRKQENEVTQHAYDHRQVGCLFLYTSAESMLDQLIDRKLDEGDLLSNANTVIYMGKIRDGLKIRRALYIAKHRGSRCSDEIHPFEIDDAGLRMLA
ncbi:MAG: ATPase domain-containing protein [Planctomycetota bacterium]|nr:ATPase domain-containing protein [Planctomycetota bacterium]